MASSGMLRRVAVVRTDVSEELRASIIRVTRMGALENGTRAEKLDSYGEGQPFPVPTSVSNIGLCPIYCFWALHHRPASRDPSLDNFAVLLQS
jgi:hypothetical protein